MRTFKKVAGVKNQRRQRSTPSAQQVTAVLSALKSCTASRDLDRGRTIHADATKTSCLSHSHVSSALITMYAKCKSMPEARKVFDSLPPPHHDVVPWNALILGYAENGQPDTALTLFSSMQRTGCLPNERTFVAALKACTVLASEEEPQEVDGKNVKLKSLEKGISVHNQAATSDCLSNIFVSNTLVDLYATCGKLEEARRIFDRISQPNVVSWNTLLIGYAENGQEELALSLFDLMKRRGCSPDTRSFISLAVACANLAVKEPGREVDGEILKVESLRKGRALHSAAVTSSCDFTRYLTCALVDMYSKCGSVKEALKVFHASGNNRDAVTWNAIISGLADNGKGDEALEMFERMLESSTTPTSRTFLAATTACVNMSVREDISLIEGKPLKLWCLEKARRVHALATSAGLDTDIYVTSALLNMFAKCGSLPDALKLSERIPRHDLVTRTALMQCHAENGEPERALEIYALLKREFHRLDVGVLVTALKACGSSVSLHVCKEIHSDACATGAESDTVVAARLVDVYGKCGSMVNSRLVFDSGLTNGPMVWTSLIAGYGRQAETNHVFESFHRMQEEGFEVDGVSLCSVISACACAGLVKTGRSFFEEMFARYGISPSVYHYNALIDMLGRGNLLKEAVELARTMPYEATELTWRTILGACWKWKNEEVARYAYQRFLECSERRDPVLPDGAAYVLMANICNNVNNSGNYGQA